MKYIVIALVFLLIPFPVFAAKSYDTPESMSSHTKVPDVMKDNGATVHFTQWILTVPPGTFSYDIYFEHGCRQKTFPLRIGRYWQISDICEFWPKSHYNLAAAEINRAWMLTYEYDESELDVLGKLGFPENSLKIVFSDDNGENWTMLKSSVVDTENNTVAAVVDKPGGYMVMAGFVKPSVYYSYTNLDQDVLGASTRRSLYGAPNALFNPVVYVMELMQAILRSTH